MAGDDGGVLHDFVAGRYAELRRSAFLMCGDWALADELTQKSLARLVAESRRTTVDDPDAFVYSHLMASFQRRRSTGRQRLFVAVQRATPGASLAVSPEATSEATAEVSPEATAEVSPEVTIGTAVPAAQEVVTRDAAPAAARHRTRGNSTTETPMETPQTRKIAEIRVAGGGEVRAGAGDPVRTILVLDALHKLAPRCRAVLVLRHWDGFAVDETADMLGLAEERVDAYEAAGLAALDYLLAEKEPAR